MDDIGSLGNTASSDKIIELKTCCGTVGKPRIAIVHLLIVFYCTAPPYCLVYLTVVKKSVYVLGEVYVGLFRNKSTSYLTKIPSL